MLDIIDLLHNLVKVVHYLVFFLCHFDVSDLIFQLMLDVHGLLLGARGVLVHSLNNIMLILRTLFRA